MMRHTCPWHLTISLSDNTENCLLPAILERKSMYVTVYSPEDYFTIIHTTKKVIKFHMCPFVLLIFFMFSLMLSTQNHFGSMPGVGWVGVWVGVLVGWVGWVGVWVFICGHGHRAKKWRTVGQKVTYSGPISYVRRAEKWRTDQNATLECYIYAYKSGHSIDMCIFTPKNILDILSLGRHYVCMYVLLMLAKHFIVLITGGVLKFLLIDNVLPTLSKC